MHTFRTRSQLDADICLLLSRWRHRSRGAILATLFNHVMRKVSTSRGRLFTHLGYRLRCLSYPSNFKISISMSIVSPPLEHSATASDSSDRPHRRKSNYRLLQSLEDGRKAFKPRLLVYLQQVQNPVDLPDNTVKYKAKYKKYLGNSGVLKGRVRGKLLGFFAKYTIDEEERKQLWRDRIGNRLKITQRTYMWLGDRLRAEGLEKDAEKVIGNDLDRTFPAVDTHEEGLKMYQEIKMLLSLFQLYRPDVGYVQGMSYILSMLYYMFCPFECFVLFCNLILCNTLLHDVFTFNTAKVMYRSHR